MYKSECAFCGASYFFSDDMNLLNDFCPLCSKERQSFAEIGFNNLSRKFIIQGSYIRSVLNSPAPMKSSTSTWINTVTNYKK